MDVRTGSKLILMHQAIKLLRVKQWIKNSFIAFPLIFSGQLFEVLPRTQCILTLLGFCFISSSVYVFNDFLDINSDKIHPKKSQRPLIHLNLSRIKIFSIIGGLLIIGLIICAQTNTKIVLVALSYVLLHIVYNFLTKHVVIFDVIFIAIGFQLRIWAGSFAVNVHPSIWLQMCVFLLTLFLGFAKRRHELISLKDTASLHRKVLAQYTPSLLDQFVLISAILTIVFYNLYTISPDTFARLGHHGMVYSIIFVLYGIFRYYYLIHIKNLGGDPGEIILSDLPIFMTLVLWTGYVVLILYAF